MSTSMADRSELAVELRNSILEVGRSARSARGVPRRGTVTGVDVKLLVETSRRDPDVDLPLITRDLAPDVTDAAGCIAGLANRPLGGFLVLHGDPAVAAAQLSAVVEAAQALCAPAPSTELVTGSGWAALMVHPSVEPTRASAEVMVWECGELRLADADALQHFEDSRGQRSHEHLPVAIHTTDDASTAMRLGIVDHESAKAAGAVVPGAFTVAGAWAVGRTDDAPPVCTVVLRRHRSTLEDAVGRDVPRYADLVYGPPAWETVELLAVQIAADLTGEAVSRTDALPTAVGELVANAITHRSYAPWFAERAITIRQFTNAVVIESPGSLPGGRVHCEGGVVRGSWSRNLRLAAFLGTLGVVRQRGDGLLRAAELGRDASFIVTVEPAEHRVLATLRYRPREARAVLDRVIERRTPLRGPSRADRIVQHLGNVGEASAQSVASALGLAPSTVRADLAKLVETGVVEQTDGSSRSPRQAYRLLKGP